MIFLDRTRRGTSVYSLGIIAIMCQHLDVERALDMQRLEPPYDIDIRKPLPRSSQAFEGGLGRSGAAHATMRPCPWF